MLFSFFFFFYLFFFSFFGIFLQNIEKGREGQKEKWKFWNKQRNIWVHSFTFLLFFLSFSLPLSLVLSVLSLPFFLSKKYNDIVATLSLSLSWSFVYKRNDAATPPNNIINNTVAAVGCIGLWTIGFWYCCKRKMFMPLLLLRPLPLLLPFLVAICVMTLRCADTWWAALSTGVVSDSTSLQSSPERRCHPTTRIGGGCLLHLHHFPFLISCRQFYRQLCWHVPSTRKMRSQKIIFHIFRCCHRLWDEFLLYAGDINIPLVIMPVWSCLLWQGFSSIDYCPGHNSYNLKLGQNRICSW